MPVHDTDRRGPLERQRLRGTYVYTFRARAWQTAYSVGTASRLPETSFKSKAWRSALLSALLSDRGRFQRRGRQINRDFYAHENRHA